MREPGTSVPSILYGNDDGNGDDADYEIDTTITATVPAPVPTTALPWYDKLLLE